MFEETLVESRGLLGSPTVRWTAACSVAVQSCLMALIVALPLLRPGAMKILTRAPELIAPSTKPAAPVVRMKVAASATASNSISAPTAEPRVEGVRGTMRPILPGSFGSEDPGPTVGMSVVMAGAPGVGVDLGMTGNGMTAPVVRSVPSGPLRVSSGVSSGMLLSVIQPVYPAIAKAARVEGTVVVEAVISRTGGIESVRAVSGPAMLRGAALDAVQRARYQPYRLNGQPVEVQTTITVNFRLGG